MVEKTQENSPKFVGDQELTTVLRDLNPKIILLLLYQLPAGNMVGVFPGKLSRDASIPAFAVK